MMDRNRIDVDFQALFYLSIANDQWSGREMQFLFAMGNDKDYLMDGFDISQNIRKVLIFDPDVDTYSIDDYICGSYGRIKSKCERDPAKMINVMRSVASGKSSDWHEDESIIAAVTQAFQYTSKDRKTVVNAIRRYAEIYDSGIFFKGNEVVILKEKMDSMLARIGELHAKLERESVSELPADHDKNCAECDFFKVCTKDRVVIDTEDGDHDE